MDHTHFLSLTLQDTKEPKLMELYKYAEKNAPPSSDPKGDVYQRIINDDHAYIEWRDNLELIKKEQHRLTGVCDYEISKERFYTERVSFAFPKDSPWVDRFDIQ